MNLNQVRWGDKHGGYGEHYWEYNHSPPKYKEHGHHDSGYGKEEPKYAPPIPKYPS